MGVFPDPTLEKSINTTPAPHHIQAFLASSLLEGATCGVIEATSQGLFQKRTRGMHWDVAVFSNLTHDHLDLHGDFETYGSLKNELFKVELEQSEKSKKYAVINTDDSWGEELYRSLKAYKPQFEIISYSPSGKQADVLCRKVKSSQEGVVIEASFFGETIELNTQLVGDFHVGNILASVAALQCLGYDLLKISNALPLVPCVPGRLQRIPARDFSVFIDYAHTPDALTSVLSSLREFGAPRIITVFGCGGDRDRAKRPVMAAAVERLSDIAVLTSDNPRTEDPQQIIEDTLRGFTQTSRCVHEAIVDRREAISRGLDLASPGDLLLIAGKGHEDYQEIHGQRFDFDDARVCLELMIEKDLV
jgi:UDP-N-acetylmuramoyl-L-alanyl-D-glutamate--2,6-diaminopimelate ligase